MNIPLPKFTEQQANDAHDAWGFNCGPAAVAAICGLTIEQIRFNLGDFELKRYTNPSLMYEILANLAIHYRVLTALPGRLSWPNFGLARTQWEGPWTNDNVPARARYRYTHWVGCARHPQRGIGIFDVNCLNNGTGWVALADWESTVVPSILEACHPRANGKYHITHSIEVAQ